MSWTPVFNCHVEQQPVFVSCCCCRRIECESPLDAPEKKQIFWIRAQSSVLATSLHCPAWLYLKKIIYYWDCNTTNLQAMVHPEIRNLHVSFSRYYQSSFSRTGIEWPAKNIPRCLLLPTVQVQCFWGWEIPGHARPSVEEVWWKGRSRLKRSSKCWLSKWRARAWGAIGCSMPLQYTSWWAVDWPKWNICKRGWSCVQVSYCRLLLLLLTAGIWVKQFLCLLNDVPGGIH